MTEYSRDAVTGAVWDVGQATSNSCALTNKWPIHQAKKGCLEDSNSTVKWRVAVSSPSHTAGREGYSMDDYTLILIISGQQIGPQ